MKHLLRNTNNNKQNFDHFDKLSCYDLIIIKGGTKELPPEEDEEDQATTTAG
ncbi:MAG: hypothetical protein JEZ09_02930 [Salinivirgaceae bacterium]|nr:hypothetical protein [Salinivirgaceae bacterium]